MRLTVWSVMSQVIRRISRLLKAATAASTIAVLAVGTSLTIGQLHPFVAGATGFVNDYPDMAAVDCSGQFGSWSWCENENNDTDPPYESSEQNSSRLYGYRNCTDGVAYWIQGYTGVTVPTNLGNGQTWDNNAPSTYSVIAGTTTTNIEPGDIAQSDDGSVGHVGFVTSVTQNSDGTVASFTTAELNQAGTGEYNGGTSTYATRDAAGKFQRQANPIRDWDNFIDVNGAGK